MHLFFDGNFFADVNLVRGDVHLLARDADVSVQHQLACLRTRGRQARAPHDVIEAAFEHDDQVFAGWTLDPLGLFEIVAELAFQQPVGALHFLLFAQLQAVARNFRAA